MDPVRLTKAPNQMESDAMYWQKAGHYPVFPESPQRTSILLGGTSPWSNPLPDVVLLLRPKQTLARKSTKQLRLASTNPDLKLASLIYIGTCRGTWAETFTVKATFSMFLWSVLWFAVKGYTSLVCKPFFAVKFSFIKFPVSHRDLLTRALHS